ncbi:MAG: hypothetical protein Ct9H90mP6_08280 [Gammaproteobacteria bacterium]|nr:MAG: hypothetical protein Ct9H90mP6_08280 [Gammaproteobacteria bacterium]
MLMLCIYRCSSWLSGLVGNSYGIELSEDGGLSKMWGILIKQERKIYPRPYKKYTRI